MVVHDHEPNAHPVIPHPPGVPHPGTSDPASYTLPRPTVRQPPRPERGMSGVITSHAPDGTPAPAAWHRRPAGPDATKGLPGTYSGEALRVGRGRQPLVLNETARYFLSSVEPDSLGLLA
ncbi:hypothetical protein GCM10017562_31550 [Streptomyces roseofulvus]